jgi:hypothetical protein
VKAAMLGATEGLVLLQAQQLATSLYTFGRGVRDSNRVSMRMLSKGGYRPHSEDQNRFSKLPVTAPVTFVS